MADTFRLIAGGLLALICCYFGVLIKRRYAEREKFFSEMTEFCAALKSDVGYVKKPLPQSVTDFCAGRKGDCSALLREYVNELKLKNCFNRDAQNWDVAHLNLNEKKTLLSFLGGLGKTSVNEQLTFITKAENEFTEFKRKSAEENKKLGGMYFKLLVLLGLAILVILA